ncbi:hypothetical protein [Polaribacter sp. Asnod6-C07]|uniref:hypothetical protein n=1 Tax=Polaribacter sp. Asnod6-C07 TaxID=3160582 RepID=UPI00386E928B
MQLKQFFVFLLILIISVVESPAYSHRNSSEYHQYSKSFQNKKLSLKKTKHIVLKQNDSNEYLLAFILENIHFKNVFQNKIRLILKLQKQLFLEIAYQNKQHIFLLQKITVSNLKSNLYIA